jgi:hypothetical protein
MNGHIRKISVGKDYPDGVLHFQVGKNIRLVGVPYMITDILLDQDMLSLGRSVYNIYISNEDGKVLWKTIDGLPVVIENNIDFS